ncbi:hypothetical protein JCM3765_003526 [Sporobolomyces pararoseus]
MNDDGITRTRVAVIGSGLAGLTAAHLLSVVPSDVHVHVFEKSEELGMDSSSISIKGEKGSYRIDVPMRSINTGSHGRVKKLYDYLKVPLVKNEFSYSFSRLPSNPSSVSAAESSAYSTGVHSRVSTPLPPYTEEPTSTTTTNRRRSRSSSPSSSPPPPFPSSPSSTTTLLYEGSSGLRWPPVSIPSSLSTPSTASLPALIRSSWQQSVYLVHLLFLAISYLHILFLSFFYVKSGLTQSRSSLRLPIIDRKVQNVGKESLESWCQRHGVLKAMKEEVLVPLMAAVCTVGVEEAREMPVGEALEYITSTFLSAHYTTAPAFGVRGIVRRLIAPVQVSNIYLSSNIQRIKYNSSHTDSRPYTILYKIGDEEGGEDEELEVDYIIFATQANQAASLLATISTNPNSDYNSNSDHNSNPLKSLEKTIKALNSFRYVQALVVNHTDQTFLPSQKSDRRDLNLAAFNIDTKQDQQEESEGVWNTHLPSTSVETTHIVSAHPSLLSSPSSPTNNTTPQTNLLQTTNPLRPIPPSKTLSSNWFSRAFVTKESKEVLPKFLLGESRDGEEKLQGLLLGSSLSSEEGRENERGGIYFTGSWCERGIPLLEGCVTSAENVVRELLEREGVKVKPKNWPF